jgi:hypothetical protein
LLIPSTLEALFFVCVYLRGLREKKKKKKKKMLDQWEI